MATKVVPWYEVDKAITGLPTNASHKIHVQREPIPIIFVPGVMGSRLRLAGTAGRTDHKTGGLPKGADGLGDGPVPRMLSSFNDSKTPSPDKPANLTIDKAEHQGAYGLAKAQEFATAAVTAIAGLYYKDHRG